MTKVTVRNKLGRNIEYTIKSNNEIKCDTCNCEFKPMQNQLCVHIYKAVSNKQIRAIIEKAIDAKFSDTYVNKIKTQWNKNPFNRIASFYG